MTSFPLTLNSWLLVCNRLGTAEEVQARDALRQTGPGIKDNAGIWQTGTSCDFPETLHNQYTSENANKSVAEKNTMNVTDVPVTCKPQ